jgi:hypothetical protein
MKSSLESSSADATGQHASSALKRKSVALDDDGSTDVERSAEKSSTEKLSKKSLSDECAAAADYLLKVYRIGENDPGLALSWDEDSLAVFVLTANASAAPRPHWMRIGPLTCEAVKHDIVVFLALAGGGSFGTILIAPNTGVQYANVRERLRDIEMHPFVQLCVLPLQAGAVLATTAHIDDRKVIAGVPANRLAPPPPLRLVFQ